jgi:DNA-binding transcriptional LysR family regulator
MMELRRLRFLHELSRRGTISAVAEALAYSPSSVSTQLALLEREAGAKLLRHAGRNVELTAAGERLAAYAAEALAADEAVRARLADSSDAPTGRLVMSIVQIPALALLPGLLGRLEESAPGVQIEVRQRETGPALEDLRARAVDLVVGVEYDPLLREDVLLASRRRDADASATASIAAFASAGWATGNVGTGLDAALRNVCNRLGGFEPAVHHRSDDGLVLGAVVASGRAVALLPALLAPLVPQVMTQRLCEERLQRTIFTAVRTASAAAPAIAATRAAIAETARAVAAEIDDLEVIAAPSRA